MDNEVAQVKHRELEQLLFQQVEDIDDTSGATVAVRERMDGFELIMEDLLGGMVEFGRVLIDGLVKRVRGGHDVFDFRRQARFLQDDGIEQDGLIGDGIAGLKPFGLEFAADILKAETSTV